MTELGHLLLADAIHRRLQWSGDLRAALYLGAIAPDAHRVTLDVGYRDVHFRSARRIGFRLVDFLRNYLRPALQSGEPEQKAFFLGWLTHLCGDDIWRQSIRGQLEVLWQRISASSRLERNALRQEFYDECDWLDMQMYQRNANLLEDIRWLLDQVPVSCTVPPMQLNDIHRWRQQVVQQKMPPSNFSVEQPRFLTLDFFLDALTLAEEEAVAMIDWESRQVAEQA